MRISWERVWVWSGVYLCAVVMLTLVGLLIYNLIKLVTQ